LVSLHRCIFECLCGPLPRLHVWSLQAFDDPKDVPFADKKTYGKGADLSGYEQLSLEAARQSMVLLKNDGILPLKKPLHVNTYAFNFC
jgi:hypothetical protein